MINQPRIYETTEEYQENVNTIDTLEQFSNILSQKGKTDEIKTKAKTISLLVGEIRELQYKWFMEELKECENIKNSKFPPMPKVGKYRKTKEESD